MCCWWIKPIAEQPPSDPLEMSGVRLSTAAPVNELCHAPSELCDSNSSKVIKKYCINGVCCQNKAIGQEFCACVDASYIGDRCDEIDFYAASGNTVIIVCVVVLIVLVVVTVVLVFWWRQRKRQQQTPRSDNDKKDTEMCPLSARPSASHTQENNTPAAAAECQLALDVDNNR